MYTIREAADRAGISSDLLRAWERRYRIVTPQRTRSGYRLYDDAAIARIRAMRTLVDEGWTPSVAAESLRGLADGELPAPAVRPSDTPAVELVDHMVERFVTAAAAMDGAGIGRFLDEIGARGSFEFVVDRYVFPALHALGDAWERGAVSVAGEHAASAAVGRWLAAAYEAAGSPSAEPRPVLIGLPPGARHELGALAFATTARRGGIAVAYLGADLPAADWVAAARTTGARAAVMAVPTADDVPSARRVAGALGRADPNLPVFFGGAGSVTMRRSSVLPEHLADAASELRARTPDPTQRPRARGPRGSSRPGGG